MSEIDRSQEHDLPLMDVLVDRAADLFNSREFLQIEGLESQEPYLLAHAASDALREYLGIKKQQNQKIDIFDLAKKLVMTTTFAPRDMESLYVDDLYESINWQYFFEEIATSIIVAEARKKHSSLSEEESRRLQESLG